METTLDRSVMVSRSQAWRLTTEAAHRARLSAAVRVLEYHAARLSRPSAPALALPSHSTSTGN